MPRTPLHCFCTAKRAPRSDRGLYRECEYEGQVTAVGPPSVRIVLFMGGTRRSRLPSSPPNAEPHGPPSMHFVVGAYRALTPFMDFVCQRTSCSAALPCPTFPRNARSRGIGSRSTACLCSVAPRR